MKQHPMRKILNTEFLWTPCFALKFATELLSLKWMNLTFIDEQKFFDFIQNKILLSGPNILHFYAQEKNHFLRSMYKWVNKEKSDSLFVKCLRFVATDQLELALPMKEWLDITVEYYLVSFWLPSSYNPFEITVDCSHG